MDPTGQEELLHLPHGSCAVWRLDSRSSIKGSYGSLTLLAKQGAEELP